MENVRPSSSKAPSIWYEAVAEPQRKPSGNVRVGLLMGANPPGRDKESDKESEGWGRWECKGNGDGRRGRAQPGTGSGGVSGLVDHHGAGRRGDADSGRQHHEPRPAAAVGASHGDAGTVPCHVEGCLL